MAYSILIVDSNRERIRAIQRALEQLQHSFILTGVMSGEEGLLEARLNPVDLVISSAYLPGMDGGALLENIRSVRPDARSILINHQAAGKSLQHSADASFDSSSTQDELLTSVTDLLDLQAAAPRTTGSSDAARTTKTPQTSIAEMLTALRHTLEAETVILMNDSGEVLVRAGSLSEPEIEAAILPALMSAFSSGARISRLLGASEQPNHYFYRGEKIHLVMSAVGQSWALVIGTHKEMTTARASAIHSAAGQTIQKITVILAELGFPLAPEAPAQIPPFLTDLEEVVEAEAESDPLLEALFESSPASLPEDAAAFWAAGEEGFVFEGQSTDGLTYQQAVQLGLAPEGEERA